MAEEKLFTYKLSDTGKTTPDAYPLTEEGGPALEAEIERIINRHWPDAYFQEQENGRILVFRGHKEATDEANAVGEVFPVE